MIVKSIVYIEIERVLGNIFWKKFLKDQSDRQYNYANKIQLKW